MKVMKVSLTILFLLIPIMFACSEVQGLGVGVNPAELNYTVNSNNIVSNEIWVFNTGGGRAKFSLYFDSQYQTMFSFNINDFELNPGSSQKVTVNYDPLKNRAYTDLNIPLYVKATDAISNMESGIKVPVKVKHYLSTQTIFPLTPTDPQIVAALRYLRSIQWPDGNIGGFHISCWVTMAIASAGQDPHYWRKSSSSIVDYLIKNRGQVDTIKVTDIAKFILAMTSARENPRNIGGVDYVSLLLSKEKSGQFGDATMCNDDFWAIISLISAGIPSNSQQIQNSRTFIKNHQNADGGWSWQVGGPSDADDTAAAIMALIASGEEKNSPAIVKAVNYLKSQLGSSGGFVSEGVANSASDSWVLMALVAANIDPSSSDWVKDGVNPVNHLIRCQNSDGSFGWRVGDDGDPWWTAYAIPALLGKPYPVIASELHPQVYVRIEHVNATIWRGWVEILPSTNVTAYNSNKVYNIQGDNALALLDRASRLGGFTYQVSDQWYPMGLYVDSIGGYKATGAYGWMYRVNYTLGQVSMDKCKINPNDRLLIYWGTLGVRPLKVEVEPVEVPLGKPFTVTVTFLDDSTGKWVTLKNATVNVNPKYRTDQDGRATVTLTEPKVYNVYAERWGSTAQDQYVRSDLVQVGVGVPIPEFQNIQTLTIVILAAFTITLRRYIKQPTSIHRIA
ncbi:DUF4430 domain-containing protein [Candidatus Bathyarchaeota archaeon]|nr:DUF4430 domain-containing protein [Candidatus Bathyarchaeota archaeon]